MKVNRAANRIEEVAMPRNTKRLAPSQPVPLTMALLGQAPDALGRLGKVTVGLVGCGSVGGRIALHLARTGFGGLLVIDPKNYSPASLATHEVDPEAVGEPKALVVARRCKAINPAMKVQAFVGPVQALELDALASVDLLVMAPDLLAVELHVGQCALNLEKPLFHASVYGPALTLHVRSFLNSGAAGPCPVCCYSQAEFALLSRQARFSCEGAANPNKSSPSAAPSTNSLSPLCSMAAAMAVMQIVRFLLKVGPPVADTILEYCAFSHHTIVTPIARNPNCKLEHTVFAQVAVPVPLEQLSLAELSRRAIGKPAPPDALFEVAGHDWVEFAACNCVQPTVVRQFVSRARTKSGRCPKCAAALVPHSFYTHRAVGSSMLNSAVEQPLRRLGARRVSSMLLRAADRGMLIRHEPAPTTMP